MNDTDIWAEFPDQVRQFIRRRPDYEQLGNEVRFALEKSLAKEGVALSSVTTRAKTLESFIEKVQRKGYDDPFSQVTDLAGVRVVCLYRDDLERVESVLGREFLVVQRIDKSGEHEVDQFGYDAIHYLVNLGDKFSGARYDYIRHHTCEIQIRTVLQDAWAIMAHHLEYKREADAPRELRRELHGLAAQLECADRQFQRIRDDRQAYVARVSELSESPDEEFLSSETNLDSARRYLAWKFPSIPPEVSPEQYRRIFEMIDLATYPTLKEIDNLMLREEARVSEVLDRAPDAFARTDNQIPAVMHLGVALGLQNPQQSRPLAQGIRQAIIQVAAENGSA